MSGTITATRNINDVALLSTPAGLALLARRGAGELVALDPAAVGGGGTSTSGNTILSGSGAPSNSLGNNGDFYLDVGSSVHNFYGPKVGGAWPAPVPLRGLDGAAGGTTGSAFRSGSGAPSNGLGSNGDFYLDVSSVSYNLYGPKAGGIWPAPFALKGPAGSGSEPGQQGDPGPAGADGKSILAGFGAPSSGFGQNGDVYIDLASPERFLYGPKSGGVWPGSPVPLRGLQGIQGLPGPAGADATLGNTAGAPLTLVGSAGNAVTAARSNHSHPFPTATEVGAAPTGHLHTVAGITNLQSILDGKAPITHAHAVPDITGLSTLLAGKQDLSLKGAANGYAGLGSDGKVPTSQLPPLGSGGGTANVDDGTADGMVPVWNQAESKYKPEAQLSIVRDRDPVVERNSATALTFADYHRRIVVLSGVAPLTLSASEIGTAPSQGMSFLVENDHTAQNTLTLGAGIVVKQPSTGTGTGGQVKLAVDGQISVVVYPKGSGLIAKVRGDVA